LLCSAHIFPENVSSQQPQTLLPNGAAFRVNFLTASAFSVAL